MGRERAVEAMRLKRTDRIPKWMAAPLHAEFLERLTGLDPTVYPKETSLKALELLDLDVSGYYERLERSALRGSETVEAGDETLSAWMGLGTGEGGGVQTWRSHTLDFSVEEVLNYDVAAHPLSKTKEEFAATLGAVWAEHQARQAVVGERAFIEEPVDWYNTVFMWGVTTFGWTSFLTAAGLAPERYARLLREFADITRDYFSAGATLDGLVTAQAHDDLCMTRGPVFHPRWYREYVFPLYPKVLAPLAERGIKAIYRGDGNVDEFVDDLAAAGFDGFYIRTQTDMGRIASKYGSSHLIIGNINTTVLTLKGKREIYEDVERCVKQAGHCPGYFFHVSGEIPYNVPTDNIFYLFEAMERYGRR